MSRERKQHEGGAAAKESDGDDREQRMLAAGRKAKQMEALRETRRMIRSKVTTQYRETVMSSLLVFRGMVSADATAAAKRELEPDVAGALKDKLLDKIAEKLKEGVTDGLDLGKRITGLASGAFGAIKGRLESVTKSQSKLTALQVVDAVVSASYEAMEVCVDKAGAAVDALRDDEVLDVYRVLAPFKNVESEEDSPDTGSLKHGLETWALEEKVGLPRTGGAIVHELAVHCYLEYQAELRATKPVHEQADELRKINTAGMRAEQKASDAEEALGPHMAKSVVKDQRERARVERT